MKIAICEDEDLTRDMTVKLIKEVANELAMDVTIFAYPSSEELLFVMPDLPVLDLLILDIQMGELNGMNLAKKIREINQKMHILFVSNYADYVFDGYEVDAIGYVMKPLTTKKFKQVLIKVSQKQIQVGQVLIVEKDGQQERVSLQELMYIESDGHYLKIVTQRGEFRQKLSLAKISNDLNDDFIQVHRSYIINLNMLTKINGTELHLINGEKIPLARSQKKKVQARFMAHYRRLAHD